MLLIIFWGKLKNQQKKIICNQGERKIMQQGIFSDKKEPPAGSLDIEFIKNYENIGKLIPFITVYNLNLREKQLNVLPDDLTNVLSPFIRKLEKFKYKFVLDGYYNEMIFFHVSGLNNNSPEERCIVDSLLNLAKLRIKDIKFIDIKFVEVMK